MGYQVRDGWVCVGGVGVCLCESLAPLLELHGLHAALRLVGSNQEPPMDQGMTWSHSVAVWVQRGLLIWHW